MNSALAATWNSNFAVDAARQIASIPSVYCGPASAGWIAAVWNNLNGRKYDFRNRLHDKNLFPDGPRLFHGRIPGFQLSLNDLLFRETSGELKLANERYFRVDSVHRALKEYALPVIVRLPGTNIRNGLHYMVAYNSEILEGVHARTIQLYAQDNGLLGGGNSGLHTTTFQNASRLFMWGARRVQVV